MNDRDRRRERVLKWYPAAWRERYGVEFAALLDDTHGEGALGWRAHVSLARAGIVQRFTYENPIGARAHHAAPERTGAVTVWCAWAFFVVAGAGFAKYSEHWDASTPAAHRALPALAVVVMQVAALTAVVLGACAGLASWDGWRRHVRATGYVAVARQLRPALCAGGLAVASTLVVIEVAHHTSDVQRNSPHGLVRVFALGWVALLVVCLAVVTWNLAQLVGRLDFSPRQLAWFQVIARLLGVAMAAVAASFVLWWVAIARFDPQFFTRRLMGMPPSDVALPMVLSGVLMGVGLALAIRGVRATRPRRA